MTYTLKRLAPGSYDVLLDGKPVASLVKTFRQGRHHPPSWLIELLEASPTAGRPEPFRKDVHQFDRLADACTWLGTPIPK